MVKPAEKPYSKNLEQLRSYIRRSNVLRCVLRTRGRGSHGLLQTIQLLLLPWSLEFAPECPTLGFTKSQQVVYSHPERYPLFMDKYKTLVNITFLLHISNFFKYHMTQPQEATLFNPFHDLEDEEKPKMWQSHLEQGTSKLGKSWKGSYGKLHQSQRRGLRIYAYSVSKAYLHDLREVPIMRSFDRGEHVIIDTIDHSEDGFQTLEFDFTPENCPPWPAVFDEHLNSFPSPALLRKLSKYTTETEQRPESGYLSPPPTPGSESREDAQCAYFPFSGAGIDADPYICSGIIHALPPQHGIPGWQRITMMKMFGLNSSGITSSQQAINPFASSSSSNNTHGLSGGFSTNVIPALIDESCWAYEGVVLPGGMIMLGRWWSPADETVDRLGTGPFIFWNVDDQ